MKNPITYLLMFFLSISITNVYGQQEQRSVSGTISDINGEPLIGVSVIEDGTNNGTITDIDGKYQITVSSKSKLKFNYISYKPIEIQVGNQTVINLTLEENLSELDEVVVIGYGAVKKRDLTGSVASLSAKKIAEIPVTNTAQALQGRVAGVLVTNTNWDPGSSPSILIRGKRSINASNDPLYVVDGIPITAGMNELSPGDIESMEILKDASATAIYGSRGANGVILITTKKGKAGKIQVDYNGYVGAQTIQNKIELMNGAEYAAYTREAYRAAGLYPSNVPNKDLDYTIIESFGGNTGPEGLNGAPLDAYTWQSIAMAYDENGNYDPSKVRTGAAWWDEVERTGLITDHQLSIKGGSEKTKFLLGLNYFKNEGIYKSKDFERYSIRLNLDTDVFNWFKVGAQTQYTHSVQNRGTNFEDNWRVNPLGRLRDDEGNLVDCTSGTDTQWWNPLLYLEKGNVVNPKKINQFFGSFYGEIKLPLEGLRFRTNVGLDFISTQDYSFVASKARQDKPNMATNATAQRYSYTIENLLFYDKTFNKDHNIGVTLLQSVQKDINETNGIRVEDLPSDDLKYYDMASGLTLGYVDSNHQEWSIASYMGRLNYNFKQRYYATVSVRRDGSSRLADGHKWVSFPAFALAWRINEESFLKNVGVIDNLKLRVGYGKTANSAVNPYQTKGLLSKIYYNFGDKNAIGYAPGALSNKTLTWETTGQWNLGLDFGFLKNRINGTIDIYKQNTSDLLLNRQLPAVSGYTSVLSNVGKTENHGIEISLTTLNVKTKDFEWSTDWMFSYNKEKIVELYNGKVDDIGNGWFIGKSINTFYDYKKAGIWQDTPEDLAEMQKFNDNGHTFTVGSVKIEDVNGDYKITADKDRQFLGQSRPKHMASFVNYFKYKNFDLSVFFYGTFGGMIANEIRYGHQAGRNNTAKYDYWTPENPTNAFPRPNKNKEPEYEAALYYEDSDFIRLKTITLGYTFPKKLISKAGISNFRIYATAQNPYVWSNYSGVDPEGAASGVSKASGYASPSVSSWIFGVNLSF
ncbi:TonB-dependent receptor [Dysgonomonas sp. 520]|uniref:SusC/RagA family TonB-linked outer membrane protein n=1 Tax=Dysgonomonas sp. 520 TaxID=2302931 RepID=UPI0013CFB794|nr:TonB-dependent receptor [Dysgonomonas sp. 520]NDW11126.1 TonB-dependent receptor [Dysgonomonas sp. 520]